jgi:hypothetical protein
VRFVIAGSRSLHPGQLVVVATSAVEVLATVVIGTGQVVEGVPDLTAAGAIVRNASRADERSFGQQAAVELALVERARPCCQAADTEILEAWVVADGSRATLVLARAPLRGDVLARELTALLGMEVELWTRDGAGNEAPVSGPPGAGLPPGWIDWLVPPGAEAVVQDARSGGPHPTAGAFIERLFPAGDNWPPPRPRRRSENHEPNATE